MPEAEGSVVQDYLWLQNEVKASKLGCITSLNNNYYINKTAKCILEKYDHVAELRLKFKLCWDF